MSSALLAVEGLLKLGYETAFWILDDHPPVGKCDSELLNEELPALLLRLEAVNIGLLGCGQRRGLDGDIMARWGLVRNSSGYRWKFSLHPALWQLNCLRELLLIRLQQFPPGQRTPWNFERHRDLPEGPVPQSLLNSTYRVHGWLSSGVAGKAAIGMKEIGLFFFDLWRFFLRVGIGAEAREAFDREGLWLYHWYLGPYPIFWSGAIRAGKPSPEFQTFYRWLAHRWMSENWKEVRVG